MLSEKTHTQTRPHGFTPVSRGVLQRKCACGNHTAGGECESCGKKNLSLQRKTQDSVLRTQRSDDVPPIVHDVLRSPGWPLDAETKAFFEPRFGHNFSRVRIHTDAKAAQSARAIHASAYTLGTHIVFAESRHEPSSRSGKELLAHELTHVVQQKDSIEPASLHLGRSDSLSEWEAEKVATAAMLNNSPRPVEHAARSIQRQPDDSASDGNLVTSSAFPDQMATDAGAGAAGKGRGTGIATDLAPAPEANCGPGTNNPFCLPFPGPNERCQPFDTLDHGISVWAHLSTIVPSFVAATTRCGEIKPLWDTYFAATSAPFPTFSDPSSCVVTAAKTNTQGSKNANDAAGALSQDILANLSITLRSVSPLPFPLGGPIAELQMPLQQAIGSQHKASLHPTIVYGDAATNAAGNIAGGVSGSKFGNDDRVMGGSGRDGVLVDPPVVIDVNTIDPASGAMGGEVRWIPHLHVIDSVDFCCGVGVVCGGFGDETAQTVTIPMSKLEVMGLTAAVPITIDYDLNVQQADFDNVMPFVGPLPGPAPQPGPFPPTPGPTGLPTTYTVVEGDYLVKIAQQFYGDGSQWRKIYGANVDVIGSDPDLIYPGEVLVIPP